MTYIWYPPTYLSINQSIHLSIYLPIPWRRRPLLWGFVATLFHEGWS